MSCFVIVLTSTDVAGSPDDESSDWYTKGDESPWGGPLRRA